MHKYVCVYVCMYMLIYYVHTFSSKCTKNPTLDTFCVYFNKHDSYKGLSAL